MRTMMVIEFDIAKTGSTNSAIRVVQTAKLSGGSRVFGWNLVASGQVRQSVVTHTQRSKVEIT